MKKSLISIILGIITLIGIFLRFNALSTYKFYPDSYVSLIVALNISTYHSVLGILGPHGMIYPDFFSWTRPLYPLLIDLFTLFTHNLDRAGHIVSFLSGVVAIPLCYLFISTALRSKRAGLFGAFMLALSYNHDVWGGFILSDTTGVMMLFLFLWLLFRRLEKEEGITDSNQWANLDDLILSAVFAFTILTRYEYAVLVVPVVFLVYFKISHKKEFFINIAASMSLVFALAYSTISPFVVNGSTENPIGSFASLNRFKHIDISAIKGFVLSDPLIAVLFMIGVYLFIRAFREKKYLLGFVGLSLLLLEFMYYQTNPGIQRYVIHLLPFLLLTASYAVHELSQMSRAFVRYGFIALFTLGCLWQGYFTYQGLHNRDNGVWFISGYEDATAQAVLPYVRSDDILITSFPEPYYLTTGISTQSVSDIAPFVYIPESEDTKDVLIVEDAGMHTVFPRFSSLIHLQLLKYKFKELPISSAIFRYGDDITSTNDPIILYRMTLAELKSVIKMTNSNSKTYEVNSTNSLLQ